MESVEKLPRVSLALGVQLGSEAMNLQSLGLKSEDKERRWLVSIYSYRGCVMDICICVCGCRFEGFYVAISWQGVFESGLPYCNWCLNDDMEGSRHIRLCMALPHLSCHYQND